MRGSEPLSRLMPALRGKDLWRQEPHPGRAWQLMNAQEQARLAAIATVVRFKRHQTIYGEGERADAVFNIISGVVQVSRSAGDRRRHVAAFVYPGDVFGLSEEGRYVNTAAAASPVAAYCLPAGALQRLLAKDAELDLSVIAKLCEELRQTQRHAFILAEHSARVRIAMFLDLQARLQAGRGDASQEIHLPMQRSAIADFIALSEAALSRGLRALEREGVLMFRDRSHVRVLDVPAFEGLIHGAPPPAKGSDRVKRARTGHARGAA